MNKVILSSFCLALTALVAGPLHAQDSAVNVAATESALRQAWQRELDRKLVEADAAEKKGAFHDAARLYSESMALTKKVGNVSPEQQKQVLDGLVASRLQLAAEAQRAGNYGAADDQYRAILKEDPKNEQVIQLRDANLKQQAAEQGRRPSQEALDKMPAIQTNLVTAATLVQDGRMFYEAGRLDEAEVKLHAALRIDPGNRQAEYYNQLVMESRYRNSSLRAEDSRRQALLDVERAWEAPIKKGYLSPNPVLRSNLVYTGKGRQRIYAKLDSIKLGDLSFDAIPLNQVIDQISKDVKARDPEKKGVNIIINQNVDPVAAPAPAVDPATGLPVAAAAGGGDVDISATTIKLVPALSELTLREALEAIIKVADRPIKYSVEDYAIIISLKAPETPALHTRTFKIDPNTFLQGLQGVVADNFGLGSGGGGGGGGGGGSRGGGGGGRGGGGGGGSRGGGGGGQGGQGGSSGAEFISVSLAGQRQGAGQQQPAAGQPRQPGTATIPGTAGSGVDKVTSVASSDNIMVIARQFFTAAGVDFTPPTKSLFFNDRNGMLMVRATLQDLDLIEQAIQVLNQTPPQITIEAKFAEITQDDTKALGFDWFLGNHLMRSGGVGVQGGSAPSFGSPDASGSPGNPSGVFPGPLPVDPLSGVMSPIGPGTIPASAGDGLLTGGLRNTVNAPALGTLTGILTDPQFRVVIRALEQRRGVNLLSAPKVTTQSGRQAQVKTVRVRYIVTDLDLSQTAGGAGGGVGTTVTTGGGGGVGSSIQPLADAFELGPVMDVVPYVSADGFTIQMTIIPTIKEFEGYDLENAQLFSAQAQSVGLQAANPLTQLTPLPIFRLRQVVTSATVWDGQTIVLGGLLLETTTKFKDKVPFLGDLPYIGRLFRSESTQGNKTSLTIFVTPTIIDPAGNRVHSEEDLPFAQANVPTVNKTP